LLTFMLFISSKTPSSQRVLGSSNWSFRHGFPSLDLLHIIILGHAFNMAEDNNLLHNIILSDALNMA
jgi:hypothetical protein